MLSKNSHQRNTENKGSDSLDIRKKTRSLKKKYGTNNPFDIAQHLGIKVIFEPLGSISGYYAAAHEADPHQSRSFRT